MIIEVFSREAWVTN